MESKNYQSGDEHKILDLFKTVFKKEMSLEYWKWRFEKNPAGKHMIRLMWENDKLVGHYAVSPVEIFVEGRKCLSALSMTTMTHPEYTGKGIFNVLAKELYHYISSEFGVDFVWGFPNNNSHYGFIKNLDWIDISQIPVFYLDTRNLKGKAKANITKAVLFEEKHVRALARCIEKYKIKVDRSLSYLNWRFIENPLTQYEIWQTEGDEGWFMITKIFPSYKEKGEFEIDILECAVPADSSFVLSFLLHIIHETTQSISKINSWLPLQDERHISFEKIGFVNGEYVTYFGARHFVANAVLSDPRLWYYSFSDSDIY